MRVTQVVVEDWSTVQGHHGAPRVVTEDEYDIFVNYQHGLVILELHDNPRQLERIPFSRVYSILEEEEE